MTEEEIIKHSHSYLPLLYSDGHCIIRIIISEQGCIINNKVRCEIKSIIYQEYKYIHNNIYDKENHEYCCNIKYIKIPDISTLDCEKLTNMRKDGNTTRQVNFAIDSLYKGYIVHVLDHYSNGNYFQSNLELFRKIIKRLDLEHGLQDLIENKLIIIDQKNLIIYFK